MQRDIIFFKPEEVTIHIKSSVSGQPVRRSLVWKDEQVRQLIAAYSDTTNAEIARRLGMKESQIAHKALKLGLRKTPEFMRFHASKSFFKPGSVPPNKGKSCKHLVTDKMRATQFKSGQPSANALHDGAITVRVDKRGKAHRFIRVALGKWVQFTRHVWEQHHGPIPKGHCVRHRDGDELNDDIENLMLITQRENRLLNSASLLLTDEYVAMTIYTKKNPELREAVLANKDLIDIKRLQIQLNRTIKTTEHDHSSHPDV